MWQSLKSSALFADISGSQLYFIVQKNNNVMMDSSFGIPRNLSAYSHHAGVANRTIRKCE